MSLHSEETTQREPLSPEVPADFEGDALEGDPRGLEKPIVVLVGMPGAGKSTIGRRIARALHTQFIDTDLRIEEEYNRPCGEIYAELGEAAFRELEARHVAQALEERAVVGLGGGAVVHSVTRELLVMHPVVWIDVIPEEGVRRTQAEGHRPVLEGDDPLQRYQDLLEQRRDYFIEVSNFRARTTARQPAQVVADVLGYLEDQGSKLYQRQMHR